MSTVIILGAGTSYGHSAPTEIRPPKATDFFTHSLSPDLKRKYEALLWYISSVLSLSIPDLDIEQVSGRIQPSFHLGLPSVKSEDMPFKTQLECVSAIDFLRSYITDLIYSSTRWLRKHRCPTHDALVSNFLKPGDTVISFNYDLILDASLSNTDFWNCYTGYGFISSFHNVPYAKSDIFLLKPHGSLNWYRNMEGLRFDQISGQLEENDEHIIIVPIEMAIKGQTARIAEDDAVLGLAFKFIKFINELESLPIQDNERWNYELEQMKTRSLFTDGDIPLIVLPSIYKPWSEMQYGELSKIWKNIHSALSSAERIIACGFSFRDDYFNEIIREVAFARRKKLMLEIWTKNSNDLSHVTDTFKDTKIDVVRRDGWLADFMAHESDCRSCA